MSRTVMRRKAKITLAGPDFRAQHLKLRKVRELDPDGEEVTHHRTVDTLSLVLQAGNITQAMHDAAREFHKAFTFACLDNNPVVGPHLECAGREEASAACLAEAHQHHRPLLARLRIQRG